MVHLLACSVFLNFFFKPICHLLGFITVSIKSSSENTVVLQDNTLKRTFQAPVQLSSSLTRSASTHGALREAEAQSPKEDVLGDSHVTPSPGNLGSNGLHRD